MAAAAPQEDAAGERPSGWWWLLAVLVVVGAVVLLVLQPWTEHETEPPHPTPTPSASETPAPQPSPTASPRPPGSDAVFDATTLGSLFVTAADLQDGVPAAADGVTSRLEPGQTPWGLVPAGASVEPSTCLTARTVVAAPPAAFDARLWDDPAMSFAQEVTVLPDRASAQEAFRDLVSTVDSCSSYTQTDPDGVQHAWAADAAIEGQGLYPSIVQQLTLTQPGALLPGYRGHLLVGNAIVTWTATVLGLDPDADDGAVSAALTSLGDAHSLSELVQGRAQQAVEALPAP